MTDHLDDLLKRYRPAGLPAGLRARVIALAVAAPPFEMDEATSRRQAPRPDVERKRHD